MTLNQRRRQVAALQGETSLKLSGARRMTRTVDKDLPPARTGARRIMSGLEYMRKLMTGELQPSGMVQLLGLKLVEVSEGRAVFTVQPEPPKSTRFPFTQRALAE